MIYKFCFLFILLLGCQGNKNSKSESHKTNSEIQYEVNVSKYLMGTIVDVKALHPNVNECKKSLYFAFKEMERIENLLSSHKPESEISQINLNSGIEPQKVSFETFSILQRAKKYSEKFDGKFDVTIGVISEIWGFSGESEARIPNPKELNSALKLVSYKNIVLNETDTTAFLTKKGMRIDLGGIAKGYAIDKAVEVLRENGVQNFLLNAGGDIFVSGEKAEKLWSVGIKHPREVENLIAKLELKDLAIATSGDYERYFEKDGKRFHHILNPETGFPSDLCQSVSVIAETAEEADVLATYIFLIGKETKFKNYFLVDSSSEIHFDKNLQAKFSLELLSSEK
ncbi:MAG: FAD:protein FMN transferase [Calditrichaeota bacterium]|nr:MAG: FAD:protein FMN transferase [Calditrichota bacterium]